VNGTPSADASSDPMRDFPEPDTPITTMGPGPVSRPPASR
jgi:hypothetical protein